MPLSLTTLPPELVGCVVASIESKSTLCNLARCSRQLYLYTTPYLYKHVTIQEETRREWQNGPLQDLASLLLQRPDLARLVRCFTLNVVPPRMRAESSPESEDSEHRNELEEVEVLPKAVKVDQALRTAVHALSLYKEEEKTWLRRLSDTCRCYPELVLALLLPALLNLEELDLHAKVRAGFDTQYLERMMGRATCKTRPFDVQLPFEALTVFALHNKYKRPSTFNFLASLLKLPAIQNIEFSQTLFTHEDDLRRVSDSGKTMELLDSSFSQLKRLALAACGLSTADLGHILRAPKSLKSLFYTVYPLSCGDFIDICRALGPQEKSLEFLCFDYGDYYETDVGSTLRESFGPITSFDSFKNLKIFKIPAVFLKTREDGNSLDKIFPPNLETLHIIGLQSCMKDVLEAVVNLVAHKSPQQIPSLKRIFLEETACFSVKLMDVLWRDTQETFMERLSRVATTQGVSILLAEAP